MEDLNVNLAIWGIVMKTMGLSGTILWNKRLIGEQWEILGSKTPEIVGLRIIEFEETMWRSISLMCERAYQITLANVYVFSDSVLCLGEMGCDPNAAWMKNIKWYSQENHFKELNHINGMQTEFEWKIFPDSRRWASSKRFKNWWKVSSVNQNISTAESSSCQCLMTLHEEKTETQKSVIRIVLKFQSMLAGFLAVVGHSWDLDQKRNGW